ncbi:hypothetical protein PHLCEN_2v13585 [Hermanssonia centrifuga]|uniref:Alpha-1,3-glucosyltransferase n=1 Tax=Hermanssonia centrifuga TaxID=98765 RepID=A0A2R6NDZ0_9APHY|nr:hypothetical protein PHLCEN_2v13585 [Hermanssonia centrifuga]
MLGILDPVTRIFPFARGLFEDKVANFWCASNVAFKWKIWMSRETLVKLSTALTAAGFLPSVIGLIYSGYRLGASEQPSLQASKEKSAPPSMPLLPLLPMWPLLKRDGLALQYIVAIVLWNRLIGYNPFRQGSKSLMQYASLAIYAACFALHLIEARMPPPTHLPDLYSVLNVLISTPVFAFTWLWSIKRGVEVGWAIGGLGSKSPAGGSALLTPSASYADGDKHFRSAAEIPSSGSSFSNVSDKSLKRRSLGFAQGRKINVVSPLREDICPESEGHEHPVWV